MILGNPGIKGYAPISSAALSRASIGFEIVPIAFNASPPRSVIFANLLGGEKPCIIAVVMLGNSGGDVYTGQHLIQCRAMREVKTMGVDRVGVPPIGDDFAKNGIYDASVTPGNYFPMLKSDVIFGRFDRVSLYKPSGGINYWKFILGKY